ncbi:MAG: SRPBCC family protein [Leptospiraceae bacterium]|nr:SRPBCC family protein [Leptospiraceae bacterium]
MEQHLQHGRHELWEFISRPENLTKITPPDMDFHILSPAEEIREMYPGLLIAYRVKPLWGIPLYWLSEITAMKEGYYFIDEQRRGPYAFWHHRHLLFDIPQGVKMIDLVYYELPFGILGRASHSLFVRQRLYHIFSYRQKVLGELFGQLHGKIELTAA